MAFEPLTRDGKTRTPQTADDDVKLRFDGWRPAPVEQVAPDGGQPATEGEAPAVKPVGRVK